MKQCLFSKSIDQLHFFITFPFPAVVPVIKTSIWEVRCEVIKFPFNNKNIKLLNN